MSIIYYSSPIGTLGLEKNKISFVEKDFTPTNTTINSSHIRNLKVELDEYFLQKRTSFSSLYSKDVINSDSIGTFFQRLVWKEMLTIPYGEVMTYKEIANSIGRPKAVRAVGNACNKNPLPIIIPCHGVVGSSGKLTGYAGGIDKKEWLLSLESDI